MHRGHRRLGRGRAVGARAEAGHRPPAGAQGAPTFSGAPVARHRRPATAPKSGAQAVVLAFADGLAGTARHQGGRLGEEGLLGPLPSGPLPVPPGGFGHRPLGGAKGQGASRKRTGGEAPEIDRGRSGNQAKSLGEIGRRPARSVGEGVLPGRAFRFRRLGRAGRHPGAAVVPGPSARRGTAASDPDGGWYVREGDHREGTGPRARCCARSTGHWKPRS